MMDFDCYRSYTTPYPSSADTSDGYVRRVCSIPVNSYHLTVTCLSVWQDEEETTKLGVLGVTVECLKALQAVERQIKTDSDPDTL